MKKIGNPYSAFLKQKKNIPLKVTCRYDCDFEVVSFCMGCNRWAKTSKKTTTQIMKKKIQDRTYNCYTMGCRTCKFSVSADWFNHFEQMYIKLFFKFLIKFHFLSCRDHLNSRFVFFSTIFKETWAVCICLYTNGLDVAKPDNINVYEAIKIRLKKKTKNI